MFSAHYTIPNQKKKSSARKTKKKTPVHTGASNHSERGIRTLDTAGMNRVL